MINNAKYPLLEAAYLYYYAMDVGTTTDEDQDQKVTNRLSSLITDALVVANNAKFDVFNALTLMDNMPVLKDLKVNSTTNLFMSRLMLCLFIVRSRRWLS